MLRKVGKTVAPMAATWAAQSGGQQAAMRVYHLAVRKDVRLADGRVDRSVGTTDALTAGWMAGR